MEINKYMERKKEIQKNIIDFIDNNQDIEEEYQNLRIFLEDQRNFENRSEMYSFLQIILKISNNHHRYSNFFNKIEQILLNVQNKIQENFSKDELFNIFKSNKRILLFLFKEKLIEIDQHVINTMMKNKYKQSSYLSYFSPEIRPFQNDFSLISTSDYFESKRQIGENEDYICQLIRKDLIEEFIIFVNKTDLKLSMTIKPSIYETNNFLIDKEPSLIEYSAFFGSIQIFKYLYLNQPDLSTSSLWLYAIHSDNSELIHFLDDQKIKPNDESFQECLLEAIKCHHNGVADYIMNNWYHCEKNDEKKNLYSQVIKYFNYYYFFHPNFPNIDDHALFDLCKYNHIKIVEFLLSTKFIDNINNKIISFIYIFF